jgi:hypothetical protein
LQYLPIWLGRFEHIHRILASLLLLMLVLVLLLLLLRFLLLLLFKLRYVPGHFVPATGFPLQKFWLLVEIIRSSRKKIHCQFPSSGLHATSSNINTKLVYLLHHTMQYLSVHGSDAFDGFFENEHTVA